MTPSSSKLAVSQSPSDSRDEPYKLTANRCCLSTPSALILLIPGVLNNSDSCLFSQAAPLRASGPSPARPKNGQPQTRTKITTTKDLVRFVKPFRKRCSRMLPRRSCPGANLVACRLDDQACPFDSFSAARSLLHLAGCSYLSTPRPLLLNVYIRLLSLWQGLKPPYRRSPSRLTGGKVFALDFGVDFDLNFRFWV